MKIKLLIFIKIVLLCLSNQSLFSMDRVGGGGGGGGGGGTAAEPPRYINLGEVLKTYGKDFLFTQGKGKFFQFKIPGKRVTIYPIKVLNQGRAIGGQSGNFTCGFHSLRNAMLFLNLIEELKKARTDEEIMSILTIHSSLFSDPESFNRLIVGAKAARLKSDTAAFAAADAKSWIGYSKTFFPDFEIGPRGGLYADHQRRLLLAMKKQQVTTPVHRDLLVKIQALNSISGVTLSPDDFQILVNSISFFKEVSHKTSIAMTIGQVRRAHFISLLVNKTSTKDLEIFVFDSSENPENPIFFQRFNLPDALAAANWFYNSNKTMERYFSEHFGTLADDISTKGAADVSTLVRKRREMQNQPKEFKKNVDSQITLLREIGSFYNILNSIDSKAIEMSEAFLRQQYQTVVLTLEKFNSIVKKLPMHGSNHKTITELTHGLLTNDQGTNNDLIRGWLEVSKKRLNKLGGGGGSK